MLHFFLETLHVSPCFFVNTGRAIPIHEVSSSFKERVGGRFTSGVAPSASTAFAVPLHTLLGNLRAVFSFANDPQLVTWGTKPSDQRRVDRSPSHCHNPCFRHQAQGLRFHGVTLEWGNFWKVCLYACNDRRSSVICQRRHRV